MTELTRTQDVVGQLKLLKTYAHLALCFPVQDGGPTQQNIIYALENAALRLTSAFPWLAGRVVNKGCGPGNSGLFEVVPYNLFEAPKTIVRFKNCSNVCPSYDEIVKGKGASKMLDGKLLGSRPAFPVSYEESESDPAPVVVFQANFIKGGLVLNCAVHQTMIDMSGLEQCFELLAMAMRGEEFPPAALEHGNMDRRNVVKLLESHEEKMDHSHLIRYEAPDGPPPPTDPDSPFFWRYFRFSAQKLAELKSIASKFEASDPAVPYITTNDAVTAFCWQRLTAVRFQRGQTPADATTKFARAVNFRRTMGVAAEYMGCLVSPATSVMPMKQVAQGSLATCAATLRKDVIEVNTEMYMRSFATFVANEPDKSRIMYGGKFNPDTDIGSSSWAHLGLSKTNFGPILGKPGLIRRPDFAPVKSVLFFLPHTEEGDIDALFCLNQVDMDGLEADEMWNSYTEQIS